MPVAPDHIIVEALDLVDKVYYRDSSRPTEREVAKLRGLLEDVPGGDRIVDWFAEIRQDDDSDPAARLEQLGPLSRSLTLILVGRKVPRPTKKNPYGVVSDDVWGDAEAKVGAARKRVKAANPKVRAPVVTLADGPGSRP